MSQALVMVPSCNPAPAFPVELISDMDRWLALRDEWQDLHTLTQASPALDFDWLKLWWDVYGGHYARPRNGLLVLTAWHEGSLAAALPLYVRRASLGCGARLATFIGSGEREREEVCSDYLDVLCRPGMEAAGQQLLETLVRRYSDRYDRLELSDVSERSLIADWARQAMTQRELEIGPRGACPIADLSGGMEAYLGRLSSNERQHTRKLLRQAKAANLRLEVSGSERFEEFFSELVDLHQKRWTASGHPGCFAARRFRDFHHQLAKRWVGEGKAILSRLRLGETTLAVKYGFVRGSRYEFYQSGVELENSGGVKSPGATSFALLMEYLTNRGIAEFDFLRGDSKYKQRLATRAQPLVQVKWVRWTWRSHVNCAGTLARRGGGKIASLWKGSNPRPGGARG